MSAHSTKVSVVAIAISISTVGCSARAIEGIRGCHQRDVAYPGASWESATVFEDAGKLWRLDVEPRPGVWRATVSEIANGRPIISSHVDLNRIRPDENLFLGTSRPVVAWKGSLYVGLNSNYGRTLILAINDASSLTPFCEGRRGMNARLAFEPRSKSLVLASGPSADWVSVDGHSTTRDVPFRVRSIDRWNESIVAEDHERNVVVIEPFGRNPTAIPIPGSIGFFGASQDRILVLFASNWFGLKRLEVLGRGAQGVTKATYALGGEDVPWVLRTNPRLGALFNDATGAIALIDGDDVERVAWRPYGRVIDVAWSERDDRLIVLTSAGYSVLDFTRRHDVAAVGG